MSVCVLTIKFCKLTSDIKKLNTCETITKSHLPRLFNI